MRRNLRFLLATPRPLLPADTGGKIRSLQTFSRLAKRFEIHAVSFADPLKDRDGMAAMRETFASYTSIDWHENENYSLGFYRAVIANQFSPLPYFVAKCHRREFTAAMKKIAERQAVDLLLCDFLQTAVPALELPVAPRILFEHNVEYLLRKRKWEAESSPIKKWLFAVDWKKTRRIEELVCKSFDHILAVSSEDRDVFEREFGIREISIIATGVDSEYFSPRHVPQRPGCLAFVGSMDWYPNEEGVIWFLREVYPLVRMKVPSANFKIIGRNPSARLQAAAASQPGVELTGRVPDVRPSLAEAELVVVPLRVGGGTRMKIPEAMAMGKAVVSTSIGAEGLHFRNGHDISLADGATGFAEAVTNLLLDARSRAEMERAARERVVREHGWDPIVDRVEEILLAVKERDERKRRSVVPASQEIMATSCRAE